MHIEKLPQGSFFYLQGSSFLHTQESHEAELIFIMRFPYNSILITQRNLILEGIRGMTIP